MTSHSIAHWAPSPTLRLLDILRLDTKAARSLRYTLVGGFCAVLNNAGMILGDRLGLHYLALNLLLFALLVPSAYLMHCAFTFRSRPTFPSLVRFASGFATGYPIGALCLVILCSGLHLPVAVASPITTVILFFWNFTAARWAIMQRTRHTHPDPLHAP